MARNKKIVLQALMGLDIGGAETHVVELCIELKKRGYRVIVVSNGGVYESLLKENNIEIQNTPLHTKNPISALKSMKLLWNIIKSEDIKLVHAHGRIPAFLLSILQRYLGFTMITTAHGTFKVNPILKLMTNWGDEVFAVSPDIRKYLIDNYHISEDMIHLTVNGINLNRFKPMGNNIDNKYIVHISRLEDTTSLVAEYLIQYAKDNPSWNILIVGDGKELSRLKEKAKGLDNLIFTGKSIDITKELNKAKIFVGISRAALEAMAYNLPIILGGNYGYMGILHKDKLNLAEFNNFTARDTDVIQYKNLKRDLDILLKEKNLNTTWEREYIKENYSIKRMVDNYEKIYRLYLD